MEYVEKEGIINNITTIQIIVVILLIILDAVAVAYRDRNRIQ